MNLPLPATRRPLLHFQLTAQPTRLVMFCNVCCPLDWLLSPALSQLPQWQIQSITLSIAVPEDCAQLPGLPSLAVAVLRAARGPVRAAVRPGQVSRVRPEGGRRAAAQTPPRPQQGADQGGGLDHHTHHLTQRLHTQPHRAGTQNSCLDYLRENSFTKSGRYLKFVKPSDW